jgi:hypothetical protein
MTDDRNPTGIENTWTDELNAALHPLDILISGADAWSIFPATIENLTSLTDTDFVRIAATANQFLETDRVRPSHIKVAVEATRQQWRE